MKLQTGDIECFANEEVKCPFCGKSFDMSYEFFTGDQDEEIVEISCDRCDNIFLAKQRVVILYDSFLQKDDKLVNTWDEGDEFDGKEINPLD